MHSYLHNIKTFNHASRCLTRVERSLYRDLIELYYDTEQPLPASDFNRLARLVLANSEEEKEALRFVLSEFFELTGDTYTHDYCDQVIEQYHSNISMKAKAGKASAEARKLKAEERKQKRKAGNKQNSTGVEQALDSVATPVHNHEPLTINHKPLSGGQDQRIEYEKIKGIFNETIGDNIAKIKDITPARKKAIKARIGEDPEKRINPEWWRKYFGYASECPHLIGMSPPKEPGGKPWRADFDWLINANNMVKVIEGKYDAR